MSILFPPIWFPPHCYTFSLRALSDLTSFECRAKPQREGFKKFLGLFTKHAKDKEIRKFDIDRRFRWEDVQAEANAAIDAYTSQVTLRTQPIRYLSRSYTNNASTLEAFLQFVPDGEYTFIICGALTLVFNVIQSSSHITESDSSDVMT